VEIGAKEQAPPPAVARWEVEHTAVLYGIPAKPKPRALQRSMADGNYYSGDDDESSIATPNPGSLANTGRFPPLMSRTLGSSSSAPHLSTPHYPALSRHTMRSQAIPTEDPDDGEYHRPSTILPPSSTSTSNGSPTAAHRYARAQARAVYRRDEDAKRERERLSRDDAIAARDRAYGATFSWRSRLRAFADPTIPEGGTRSLEYGTSLADDIEARVMTVGLVEGDEKHVIAPYTRSLGPSSIGKGGDRQPVSLQPSHKSRSPNRRQSSKKGSSSSGTAGSGTRERSTSPSQTRPLWQGAPGPYVGHHVHGVPPPRRAGSSGPLPPKKIPQQQQLTGTEEQYDNDDNDDVNDTTPTEYSSKSNSSSRGGSGSMSGATRGVIIGGPGYVSSVIEEDGDDPIDFYDNDHTISDDELNSPSPTTITTPLP
jgi:hypothetical protein